MDNKKDIISTVINEWNSSTIGQVDYDPLFDKMTIFFRKNSNVYEYYAVSKETYNEFVSQESPGKYFQTNIRGKYEYARRGEVKK